MFILILVQHLENLSENMKAISISGRVNDVIVKVKDQEFPVHKSLLSAWSPVFASMFEKESGEASSNIIEITDCDPDTFRYCLEKLYSGRMDDIATVDVCGIYKIASKYEMTQIKADCIERLLRDLSIDTFCHIALVAFTHGDAQLLEPVSDLFTANTKAIFETASWSKFIKEHHVTANEILQSLVKNENEST